MSRPPYIVGQWVRGPRFYGRRSLLDELLESPRSVLWVLGTRRIGKTSLLKELEHRTASGRPYFPLFWDFQGATTPEELRGVFEDALVDGEERLEEMGVRPSDVMGDDVFDSIRNLRRQLRDRRSHLLLLCDEVEELLTVAESDPAFLGRLRRTMHHGTGLRTVLASTVRLFALARVPGDTSPFLHGCEPPLYLCCLEDAEARSLIRQDQLPEESRPGIPEEEGERIRLLCGNHPYLIQLLCKRYLESGDLNQAMEEVDQDPMVDFFFTVDFEMLEPTSQEIVSLLADGELQNLEQLAGELGIQGDQLRGPIHRLRGLGYLEPQGRLLALRSFFLRRWLARRLEGRESLPPRTLTGAGRAIAAEALDRLAMGVVLVDVDLNVVFANRSGREILERGDGLREGSGGLETRDAKVGDELRVQVREAAKAGAEVSGLQLARENGGASLSVVVLGLTYDGSEAHDAAVAALFVTDPDRPVDSSDEVLRSVYRLTRAETRLAQEVLSGHSLDDAALRLGVSINTARTHMRRILAKTGTHRQSEFIRLVLSGPLAWVQPR